MESPSHKSSMIRKSFVMQLAKGAEKEYHQRHNPIWRELEETIHAHGVHNYSIFLHPDTEQLFAYAEIEDELRWKAIAQTEVCRRWWDYMAELMVVNEDRSPRAVELDEMFHLE